MSAQTFALPDVGEGLTEAEIVNWLVAPGDDVALNQVVCEIETAKSLVELPSPFEGVVTELLAEVGQTVPVGEAILRIETGSGSGSGSGGRSANGSSTSRFSGRSSRTRPAGGSSPPWSAGRWFA